METLSPEDRTRFALAERVEAEVCASLWGLAPGETIEALRLASLRVGASFVGVAPAIDAPMYNRALSFGLDQPLEERDLAMMVDFLRAANAPRAFVQLGPGALPDGDSGIAQWLAARGLRRFNRWIRLVRDAKAPLPVARGNAAWRIEEIGPEHAADFARIDAVAFNQPDVLRAWSGALVGKPGWRAYLAFDGETPIACAASFHHEGVAWNGFAGTLEAYRGRGAQSALIARRIADAAQAGCHTVVVETAEDRPDKPAPSYHNQIRFGFEPIYARENWLLAGKS